MNSQELREKHPVFTLHQAGYELTDGHITFWSHFSLGPDITFKPHVRVSLPRDTTKLQLEPQSLQQYAFFLSLAEIPSYWKAALSPRIVIEASPQLPGLEVWLRQVLLHGLSEFYFVNDIDQALEDDFVRIEWLQTTNAPLATQEIKPPALTKALLPLGGGKDSLVALETLKQFGLGTDQLGLLVLMPSSPAALALAQESGLSVITAERMIDPKLLELNDRGYLNGHTPFSAYLSVLSSCAGYLFGYSHVALANERSANEGNSNYQGLEVNHQWSKSFDYETLFQSATTSSLPLPAPYYFSLLRPLYEIQIAGLFADFYQDKESVLSTFRSCNRGQRDNVWCLSCPKCLFAYLILAPFLPPAKLKHIFGADLFANKQLLPVLHDLVGKGSTKPLECVGMYEESLLAGFLAIKRWYQPSESAKKLPLLLAELQNQVFPKEIDLQSRARVLITGWNQRHALPSNLSQFLKETIHHSPSLQKIQKLLDAQP